MQRLAESLLQPRRQLAGLAAARAQHGVASQFLLQSTPLVPVNPGKDAGVRSRGRAPSDPVRPVLGQAVLRSRRLSFKKKYNNNNKKLIQVKVD